MLGREKCYSSVVRKEAGFREMGTGIGIVGERVNVGVRNCRLLKAWWLAQAAQVGQVDSNTV